MADVFLTSDVHKLLKNKHIIFIGDSNIRAQYKDLIWLLNHNLLINQNDLKSKQIGSLVGDKVKRSTTYGVKFREERKYEKDDICVQFYFITQCFPPLIENLLEDIHLGIEKAPDVIYINSTLWDCTRYGPNFVAQFKDNLVTLAKTLRDSLPPTTLVIWGTALPIAPKIASSLLTKKTTFLEKTLRFDVMEANLFARQVMINFGHDVLDNHFYMRMQIHRRVKDGVHFYNKCIRFLTNLLLTHIALSWDQPLPNRIDTLLLEKSKKLGLNEYKQPDPVVPDTPKAVKMKTKNSKFKNGKKQNHQQANRRRANRRQRNKRKCNRQQILHNNLHSYQGSTHNIILGSHQLPQPWQESIPMWEHNENQNFARNLNIPSLLEINQVGALGPRMHLFQNQRFQPY